MHRALVAEDDLMCRRILVRLIATHVDCAAVATGPEALATLQAAFAANRPYHLICLDIEMPGLTGHEVLAELRRLEAAHRIEVPARVLITTAHSHTDHVMAAVSAGCDGFLVKPLDPSRVMAHLVSWGMVSALERRAPSVEHLKQEACAAVSTAEIVRKAADRRPVVGGAGGA